jgi:uncharacterized protein YlxW (UPF0749 family)
MNKAWQLPVTAISLSIGVLLATQFKSQADFAKQNLPSRRVEDLVLMLNQSEEQKDDLGKEVKQLRARLEELERGNPAGLVSEPAQAGGDPVSAALQGPGVEVNIKDSAKPIAKGEDPNIAIVHNDDLLRLVNELRTAGAEAIVINDQRMVESSEITCAGTTILVNKSRIAPPFVIRAIGDPDAMAGALKMRGGIVEYLQFYGIQVNISKKSEVLIPAFSGSTLRKYAKPAPAKVDS